MDNDWRSPNLTETNILERMLSADFPGVDVLRKQVRDLKVRKIAGEESLELKVRNQVRALLKHTVPVEAEYCDTGPYDALEQVHVHCLLHVTHGLISELEFYKDDGTKIVRLPEPSELHIFTPDNWSND